MSNTITDERGLLKDDTKTAAENPILKGFRLTDGEICRIMHHKSEWEKKNWKEGMEDEEKQEIAEAAAKELGMTVTPSRGKFREWNVQYGPDGYSMVRARLFEHKLLIAFKILDARKLSIKTPCTKPYKAPDAPERSADDALDFLADRVDAGTGTDEKRDSPATKKPKKKEDTVPEMLDYCHSQSREGMRPAYDAAMGDVHAETPSKSEHNGDDDDETTPHGSTPLKASKA